MLQSLFGMLYRLISSNTSAPASPITPSPSSSQPAPSPVPSDSVSSPPKSSETVSIAKPKRQLAWGKHPNMTEDLREKIFEVAAALGIDDASDLASCMAFETGPAQRFLPNVRNAAGSGAVGLIQFMPLTLKDMGYTVAQAAAMTAVEQMDLVYLYLKPYVGRMKTLSDIYLAILWPKAVGKPDSEVLWTAGGSPITFRQNSGLDVNKDSTITKGEAAQKVADTRAAGMTPRYLWVEE